MSFATARNIVIILAIAAVVAFVPGGSTVGGVIVEAVSLLFLAAIGWVAAISYRQHRDSLLLLGDTRRGLLYGALAVLAVTLTATSRLWGSAAGSVAWLVLVGASLYTGFAVIWAARRS